MICSKTFRVALLLVSFCGFLHAAQRPNIVFVIADD